MKLRFDPPFLPVQTAAVTLVVLAVAFWLYVGWELRNRSARNAPLIALRSVIILLLVVILLNPSLDQSVRQRANRAPFAILLDTSRSMDTADVPNGSALMTRWAAAKQAVLETPGLREALGSRYSVQFYGFNSQAIPRSPEELMEIAKPAGDHTALADALNTALQTMPSTNATGSGGITGGILLVSDGRDNGVGSPLSVAREAHVFGHPLYTLCLGQDMRACDIEVVAQRAQVFSAPGQPIDLEVELRANGIPSSRLRVDLLRDGKRVASKNVTVATGRQTVAFPVQEANKGFYRYAVVCAPAPGETDLSNNRANIFLSVLDARARVLLLEGEPSWDAKFLAQTLRNDATISLDTIAQVTDTQPFALSGDSKQPIVRLPKTVADLSRYDVVLLGKGYESFFDDEGTKALKQWVGDHGGNLIFLRGRADQSSPDLSALEPIRYSDQEIETARVQLTEAGRTHPGFAFDTEEDSETVVQKLPALISATRVQDEKALAVVLARAPGIQEGDGKAQEMAMLAYQRYGQGKAMSIIGQGLWRWAFLPPDMAAYQHVYSEFWTQTIRWMVSDSDFLPGQGFALRTDRSSYSGGDTVNFTGVARGAKSERTPAIHITQPDGKTVEVATAPGDGRSADFVGAFHPDQPGEYLATVMPPPGSERTMPASAPFMVFAGQQEDANRAANPTLMRQIAAVGGGQALRPGDLISLPEKLRAAELADTLRQREPKTLWDRGWLLAMLAALLTAEWVLRRRKGLA